MNELQAILGETCTRLFTDHATTAVLEGAEKGEWPAALWQALEENGLTLPQVPEARGGAGGSWSDAFVVLMASGRFAAPVPLAETMLAGAILAETGLDAPLGPMTVAPVHVDERLTLARLPYRIGTGDMAAQYAILQQHGQMIGVQALGHQGGKADLPHRLMQQFGPVFTERIGHIHFGFLGPR